MAPTEGFVTTQDGVQLFFEIAGKGSRTVLIPNATYMFDDFKHLAEDRTMVFYDLRNRGRSESIADAAKLKNGVQNDVEDLEAIRRHFGVDKVDVIAHSYLGLVIALYGMKYPSHVNRLVQIGPVQPFFEKQYPKHLTGVDATMDKISAELRRLQQESKPDDPALGRKMWSLMRQLYVADPADADKITWSVDHLPNETMLNVMKHYSENLLPSMRDLRLTTNDLAKLTAPVLIIHGRRDRQAPYGGGLDWASTLPDARLVTIEDAAHLPWIEAPDTVFASIRTFLDGAWPDAAKRMNS